MIMDIKQLAAKAKGASKILASLSSEVKDEALKAIKKSLNMNSSIIIEKNKIDLTRSEEENLAAPLLKRLTFQEAKIAEVSEGIDSLLKLADPVGKVNKATELDEGLILNQVSCPIGVISMIFESRPDALVQIASLALKSGNGVILKGGSEAKETNRILFELIDKASVEAGLPEGWIVLAESREDVSAMLELNDSIDLIIPRGSNEFVSFIMKNTSIPVMGHADGICHSYVDKSADLEMAVKVVVDSKTQYVAVCNALETLLVHSDIAKEFLPKLKTALDAKNTELRGCSRTTQIINIDSATEEDWKTEYLDYILSIKVVDSIDEAIDHIHKYGSGHTDMILTNDSTSAENFLNRVDSADVYWNCSTRFCDGFKYGLGAEVGVSTNRLHARGPVGMDGLLSYKWKLRGNGHIAADYAEGRKSFTHKPLS